MNKEKQMKITVNAVPHDWNASMINYGAVLSLANQSAGASVVYSGPRRGDTQRSGTLHAKSQPIAVEDGMHFSAVHTNNA